MNDVSVVLPVQHTGLGQTLPYARLAAATRTQRLWCGQSFGVETHALFAALAGAGHGLQFGSAVALAPLRHPLAAALAARSVAVLSERPYVAAFGPGATGFQRGVRGAPYRSPLAATREYVTTVRDLLDGKPVTRLDGEFPADGLRLPQFPAPPVHLGLGVLRGRMAELAGESVEWAVTWLTPPEHLSGTVVPRLAAGAARAGRDRPRVATVLQAVVARPGRDVLAAATASCEQHVQAAHYVDMLARSGIHFDEPGSRARAARLVETGVIAAGTPAQIAGRIGDLHRHGADEVVVNVCGTYMTQGPGAAARDLSEILDAHGEA
ncbi:LLM class flavin-dependent oxidoreductase [Kineococcus rhizosphaerae]|uniref:Alkanesulfonate monooxygenase SsuD/methylene tetrahydromethanopterin reductase-like flavin-dependent oxidoreductase (Luciferase family) n=1 Tax=Kineococcus rhizosphaerae TaxID=559628 RepID=A0A2T0QYU0_9ACTN|nr:LLM class flavin-dependent oxidoreductase [Kineococcus rhizosphaerae]PRY11516.1 alkanesulfonate monooxygenase SsuD/methylene tetrahydromethanopterin reductase-like flavin-dependent oxidoreductase (luciferase family) [Kineococcus rhizosphaerae]